MFFVSIILILLNEVQQIEPFLSIYAVVYQGSFSSHVEFDLVFLKINDENVKKLNLPNSFNSLARSSFPLIS